MCRTAECRHGAGSREHAAPALLRFPYCKAGCFIMLQFPRTPPAPPGSSHEPICMTQLESSPGFEQVWTERVKVCFLKHQQQDQKHNLHNLHRPAHCNVFYDLWSVPFMRGPDHRLFIGMDEYEPPWRNNLCLFSTRQSPAADVILSV